MGNMPNARSTLSDSKHLLSPKQIAVLRLVYCNLTSKEIGRQKGVSSYAVDALIERAMQRLGAANRMEAARWVMQHIPGPYERFVYEVQPVAGWGLPAASIELSDQSSEPEEAGVAEAIAAYTPPNWESEERTRQRDWRDPGTIGPRMRMALIPAAAFLTLAITFTLLAAGMAASDWANRNLAPHQQANR